MPASVWGALEGHDIDRMDVIALREESALTGDPGTAELCAIVLGETPGDRDVAAWELARHMVAVRAYG